jgi:hypothetical protein
MPPRNMPRRTQNKPPTLFLQKHRQIKKTNKTSGLPPFPSRVRERSPGVREKFPGVRGNSPSVRGRSPGVRGNSYNVREKSSDVRGNFSAVRERSSGVRGNSPGVWERKRDQAKNHLPFVINRFPLYHPVCTNPLHLPGI